MREALEAGRAPGAAADGRGPPGRGACAPLGRGADWPAGAEALVDGRGAAPPGRGASERGASDRAASERSVADPAAGACASAVAAAGAWAGAGRGAGLAGAALDGAGLVGAEPVAAGLGALATEPASVVRASVVRAPGRAAGRGAGVPPGLGAPVDLSPDLSGAEPPPVLACSRSLRTTGGSMVDEADRTNSPMSFSFDRTSLLSSPSSLASS